MESSTSTRRFDLAESHFGAAAVSLLQAIENHNEFYDLPLSIDDDISILKSALVNSESVAARKNSEMFWAAEDRDALSILQTTRQLAAENKIEEALPFFNEPSRIKLEILTAYVALENGKPFLIRSSDFVSPVVIRKSFGEELSRQTFVGDLETSVERRQEIYDLVLRAEFIEAIKEKFGGDPTRFEIFDDAGIFCLGSGQLPANAK
jgi:hypothetical protein